MRNRIPQLNPVPALALAFLFVAVPVLQAEEPVAKPNILFISIDDLRPELGCYGSPIAKSPNLDRLAAEGLQFNRAYCQEAICAPSRASLLTGFRPDVTGITHNSVRIREVNPDAVTLPQYFKENGYETFFTGKIFHWTPSNPGPMMTRAPVGEKGISCYGVGQDEG